jgi:hypothetical protein
MSTQNPTGKHVYTEPSRGSCLHRILQGNMYKQYLLGDHVYTESYREFCLR